MAATETQDQERQSEETNGGNENGGSGAGRKAAVRAAAIAAASGATAIAARKAFSGRGSDSGDEGGEGSKQRKGGGTGNAMLTTALTSGWDSARDSLVPMLEDAATHAGEYVARNAPDIVSETIVPQFIRGFERAHKKSGGDSDDED